MNIPLEGKHFMTFGKKNTGKSYFTNYLMSLIAENGKNYLSFDPLHEHYDYNDDSLVVNPDHIRGEKAINEFDEIVEFSVHNRDKFDYVFADELNRYHSKGGELDGPIGDLVDFNAHYGMGICGVARRPVQVHTDLTELADYTFIFRLTGQNDIRRLDGLSRGLGERVASLDRKEFMILYPDGGYKKHPPIRADLIHEKGF